MPFISGCRSTTSCSWILPNMLAKIKPKDVFGGNEAQGYRDAALIREDVLLPFGHKGATKMAEHVARSRCKS